MEQLTPTSRRYGPRVRARLPSPVGVLPTIREVAAGLGLSSWQRSPNTLDSLEGMGLIRRHRDARRSVVLTPGGRSLLSGARRAARAAPSFPLLGTIAAASLSSPGRRRRARGSPLARGRPALLRAPGQGQSMIDRGIFDGDYVVVEEKPSPENGETWWRHQRPRGHPQEVLPREGRRRREDKAPSPNPT